MSYKMIMGRMDDIAMMKMGKTSDFFKQVANLREVMKVIGKNTITLNTSEPLGAGHTFGLDKKYSLTIGLDRISFLTNTNQNQVVDEPYINSCKWFQVYIYTVEIEFELKKIYNHIGDSVAVSERINGGE